MKKENLLVLGSILLIASLAILGAKAMQQFGAGIAIALYLFVAIVCILAALDSNINE